MSDLFYRAVIQVILLFRLNAWELSDAMMKIVEGNHVGLLHNITRKRSRWNYDEAWETPTSDLSIYAVGKHLEAKYIGRWQAIVA